MGAAAVVAVAAEIDRLLSQWWLVEDAEKGKGKDKGTVRWGKGEGPEGVGGGGGDLARMTAGAVEAYDGTYREQGLVGGGLKGGGKAVAEAVVRTLGKAGKGGGNNVGKAAAAAEARVVHTCGGGGSGGGDGGGKGRGGGK